MNLMDYECRTCTSHELSHLTMCGWKLVEIREEEYQELGLSYSTQERNANGYTEYVSKQGPPVLVKRLVYVIARHRDEIIEELRTRIAGHETKEKDLEARVKKAEANENVARESVEFLQRQLKSAGDAATTAAARFELVEKAKRKLEEDIAKLTTEIGAARIREILKTTP